MRETKAPEVAAKEAKYNHDSFWTTTTNIYAELRQKTQTATAVTELNAANYQPQLDASTPAAGVERQDSRGSLEDRWQPKGLEDQPPLHQPTFQDGLTSPPPFENADLGRTIYKQAPGHCCKVVHI
jgi:hypothetical protein